MDIKRFIWPSHRLQRLAVILGGGLILYTLVGFFLLPVIIQHVAVSALSDQLQRKTSIEKVRFNPYALSCDIRGLSIAKRSGQGSWIALERLLVNLQASSLFRQALVVSQLLVDHPRLSVTRYAANRYSFSDLLQDEAATAQKDEEGGPLRFSLNNIQILNGEAELIDQPAQTRHTVSGLSFTLPTLSNFPYAVETFVEPHFAAKINDMSFELGGETKPFAQSRQTRFDIVIDNLALPNYLGYLPAERNFDLGSGRLSTDLRLTYAAPSQDQPHLKLEGSLELHELRIIEQAGKETFCALPRLALEFRGGNLLAGELHLGELRIQKPELHLVRSRQGALFLPALGPEAGAAGKEAAPSPEGSGRELFSLVLDRLQLEAGKIGFTDRTTAPAFSTTLQPVRLSLSGLRTASQEPSELSLDMRTVKGEALSVTGSLSLNPLRLEAEAELSDIVLNHYAPYYGPFFRGTINQGTCDAAAQVFLKQEEGARVRLEGLRLGVSNLSVSDAQGQKAVAWPTFLLEGGRIDPAERELAAGSIKLEQGDFRIRRLADGRLNLAALAAAGAPAAEAPEAKGPASSEPWGFAVDELQMAGSKVELIDATTDPQVQVALSDISCELEQISNAKGKKGSLDISLRIGEKGRLKVQGGFGLSPLEASLELGLEQLDARPFAPLVPERVNLAIDRALLSTAAKLELRRTEDRGSPSISLQGEATVQDLKTSLAGEEGDLLSWKRLGLKGLGFRSDPLSLRIEAIELDGLDTRLLLHPDGSSNIQRLLPSDTASAQEQAQSGGKAIGAQVMIDRVSLSRGRLRFVDASVSPSFESTLSDVQGTFTELGNQGDKPAGFVLQADLGGNAPLRLSGKAHLLGERFFTDVELHLANIALSPLSAYSGKYIGYTIDKGKFNLDSTVRIEGEALESDHSLLLDQLSLGDKVDSPEAVNAPVKLGIALLKNRKGEIHIDKSVSGDLSDPEFTVGDLVMRVFVNVLVKAATSPFAVLGAMFGGGEDINVVHFAPGRARLDDEAEKRMSKLGKALYERPELKVDVLGRADTAKDRAALEERRFQQLLREQKYLDLSKKEQAETTIDAMRIMPEEHQVYLWKAYKAAPMEKPRNALGLTKKLPPEEIEERLRASVAVGEDDVRQLAAARAKTVLSFLQEAGPVAPDRLFLQHPELGTGQGDAFIKAEVRMH